MILCDGTVTCCKLNGNASYKTSRVYLMNEAESKLCCLFLRYDASKPCLFSNLISVLLTGIQNSYFYNTN